MEQIYTPQKDYKVLVRCFTYNQSKYIEDALNGFAMQKTNFPFACLVMDDCSTDGEQEVIKAWMECECDMAKAEYVDLELSNVIIVPHKTNENCTFAFYLLKQNLYGTGKKTPLLTPWREHCEYEALCEGDDFWTYPEKLQKQYNAMESHLECVICLNRVQAVKKDGMTKSFIIPPIDCCFSEGLVGLDELVKEEFADGHWCFHTSSFFIRTSHMPSIIEFQKKVVPSFPYGDMPFEMYCLRIGGYFIEETMGCYRLLSGGWNSTMNSNLELKKKMQKRVIEGFREFDVWTDRKYNKEVELLILRKEFYVFHEGISFRIKYWRFMLSYLWHPKNLIGSILRKYLPNIYNCIRTHLTRKTDNDSLRKKR